MTTSTSVPPEAALIPCLDRHGEVSAYSLVDLWRFEELSQWRWFLAGTGQIVRNATVRNADGRRRVTVNQARQVLGLPPTGSPRVRHRPGAITDLGLGVPVVDNRRAVLSLSRREIMRTLSDRPVLELLVTEQMVSEASLKAVTT